MLTIFALGLVICLAAPFVLLVAVFAGLAAVLSGTAKIFALVFSGKEILIGALIGYVVYRLFRRNRVQE